MNQRPTTSVFVCRFATSIATCMSGLMPVLFVSDASAALIDIVVVGTWESASGRTTLDLDAASETGALKSRQGRYRTVTPFTWSTTADSITVTFTGPTRFYETGTGKKVDFEKASKGGTVHCAFTGDTLTVGGVAYRRQ